MDFADAEGHTALHAACAFGLTDCVRMLIQAGASLNLPDCIQSHKLGNTPTQSHQMRSVGLVSSGCAGLAAQGRSPTKHPWVLTSVRTRSN